MVLIKRLFLLIPFLLVWTSEVIAQDRCGTVQYENLLQGLNPSRKTTDQFEEWMKAKISQAHMLQKSFGRTSSTTYTIPIVVHIIHNGEAVGTGLNISDAQINSQIAVLNEDFQRLNADAINTPSEFLAVAGSMSIEFILARQDPHGEATTGIVRVKGTKTSWSISDNYQLKASSYWPAENYLNIWVTNLVSPNLGYAQFRPIEDMPLGGLDNNTSDRLTDGVVLDYTSFGKGFPGLVAPYNLGRTTTHEIGHFFGLRHIWGDSNCGDDYVADTPKQESNSSGCPSNPQASCEAAHPNKMFQNYMDYSNDACMNIYTIDQFERIDVVLNNSSRRKSLLSSPGATAPAAFDLGIKRVVSPTGTSCAGQYSPTIKLKNFGTTFINSARVEFSLNGSIAETKDIALSLNSQDSVSIIFSPVNLIQSSTSQFNFKILATNGTIDGNSFNDTFAKTVTVPAIADASLTEIFNTVPSNWSISNPDGLKTWENITANNGTTDNKAIHINLYNSLTDNDGTTDWLITPVMDFSIINSALLKFDRSFALYSSTSSDGLKVLVSNNCGSDFSQAVTIFNKSGSALAVPVSQTNSNPLTTTNSFTPSSSAQWLTETISLQQFIGQPNIQLAFVVTNGNGRGNNLYLDNVLLTSDAFTDIALTNVSSLSPVICSTNPVPVMRIKNNGSSAITSFNLDQTINGITTSQSYTNQFILPSEEKEFALNALSLNIGLNTISFNLKEPNGTITDALPTNNSYTLSTVVNQSTDIIPLYQNFESTFTTDWTIISQGTQRQWETTNTSKGVSLLYRAFAYNALGSEAWFVSPQLDFSRAQEASLFFDLSYAKSTAGNDGFRILASTDCGVTYPDVLYQRTGDQISVTNFNSSWSPLTSTDWKREYVDLTSLAGKKNIRLAMIATNNRGNNLYLDNLEFFTDSNPNPPKINTAFSIYSSPTDPSIFKVTFNLSEKKTVRMLIYTIMGQMVVDNILPETLNQTYTIDFREQSTGIYIVRLHVDNAVGTQKIFVGH